MEFFQINCLIQNAEDIIALVLKTGRIKESQTVVSGVVAFRTIDKSRIYKAFEKLKLKEIEKVKAVIKETFVD